MSLTGDRQAIATALSNADGVTGYPYRPTPAREGDGWPLVAGLERGPAQNFEATWRVAIALPANERAASEWFDDHHASIVEALEDAEVGYVDRIEPATLNTEGGDQDIMLITFRSEA